MKIIYILWISFLIPFLTLDQNRISRTEFLSENSPVVRESTTDIQVRVGEKLYVFGKAQGTLDKVKIGFHVLHFAQNPSIAGINSNFHTVSWKKLKSGAIQIQSSYQPWPSFLTWLVLPDGQLKMEALSSETHGRSLAKLGLGFDFPEEELKNISLNNQLLPISPESKNSFSFKNASFEFDNVKLSIISELSDLELNTHFSSENSENADIVISFPDEKFSQGAPSSPGPVSGKADKISSDQINRMVLWFDFH